MDERIFRGSQKKDRGGGLWTRHGQKRGRSLLRSEPLLGEALRPDGEGRQAGKPLAPKKRPGSKPELDERAKRLLAEDVAERPFLTHSERREYLKVVAGVSVSNSTLCREIQKMERTRKKGA